MSYGVGTFAERKMQSEVWNSDLLMKTRLRNGVMLRTATKWHNEEIPYVLYDTVKYSYFSRLQHSDGRVIRSAHFQLRDF